MRRFYLCINAGGDNRSTPHACDVGSLEVIMYNQSGYDIDYQQDNSQSISLPNIGIIATNPTYHHTAIKKRDSSFFPFKVFFILGN